jgi:hypothetical protein
MIEDMSVRKFGEATQRHYRIRHYGRLANGGTTRAEKLSHARQLIATAPPIAPSPSSPHDDGTCEATTLSEELHHPCPHCGSRMVIIETFEPGRHPRHRPCAPSSRSRPIVSPPLASAGHDQARAFSSFPQPICRAISFRTPTTGPRACGEL